MKNKTEVLYVYVTKQNKEFVKKMRANFKSESNFVNQLLSNARKLPINKLAPVNRDKNP